ncbi:hypothetical protein IJ843_06995 [bacterium]|nr:hypothetical protein [bacterium]
MIAADQLYNIEIPSDEGFLSSSQNIMAISIIFQQAFDKYLTIYKKKDVPISFIKFYIEEIKNYNYMFRKSTKDFFDAYENIKPNFDVVAKVYLKSFFSQCSSYTKRKDEQYLTLAKDYIIDYTTEMESNSSKDVAALITNIKKITEHINSNDEIFPLQRTYENYMIANIIRDKEFKNNLGKSKVILNIYNNDERPEIVSATKRAERLTSERISTSNKKGKVTKIVIPKLKLPSAYPKTVTFNRFNSKYRARNFISTSREILILNDLKINGVAYSQNFVDKRKAINEG